MRMALIFPNEDTLRMALTSGLAPTSLSLSPAYCARSANGSITLAAAIPESVVTTLQNFGVTLGDDPAQAERLGHWLEALPLARNSQPPILTDQTPVLFELPAADVAHLVGEMLRLGNDRQ